MGRNYTNSSNPVSNQDNRQQSHSPNRSGTGFSERNTKPLSQSSKLRHGVISNAKHKLNHQAIQSKIINTNDGALKSEQESRMASIFAKDEKTMIKIEYYDTLLNMERKCQHFTRLFQKIRLRVVHKPFIILDMLKLMDHRGSSHYAMSAMYNKLETMRRRQGLDAIIAFVERRREIETKWGNLSKTLLAKTRRALRKRIEAEKIREMRGQRMGRIVKRGVRYMATVVNNTLRDRVSYAFKQIERRGGGGRGSYWRHGRSDYSQNNHAEGSRVQEKTSELRIQENQGFIIEKSAEKNRRIRNTDYPDYFKKNINSVMADVDVTGSKGRRANSGSQKEGGDSKDRKKSRLFFEEEGEETEEPKQGGKQSGGKGVNIFDQTSSKEVQISKKKLSQRGFHQQSKGGFILDNLFSICFIWILEILNFEILITQYLYNIQLISINTDFVFHYLNH